MKTQIKRFSKSTLAVVLTLCMIISCMTVGLIATDAAKVDGGSAAVGAAADEAVAAAIDEAPAQEEGAALDTDEADDVSAANSSAVGAKADSESVGAANVYAVAGTWNKTGDNWNLNYFNADTKKVTANLTAGQTYEFKIVSTYDPNNHRWYGANKTYTASDSEYYFNHITEDNAKIKASVTGTYTFTLKREDNKDGAVAIAVTYPAAAKTYTVTPASTKNGTFTVSPTTATAGTTITVNAKPNRGFEVDTVTATGVTTINGTGNTRTFTMPAQNTTVTVTFKAATSYTLTANQVTTGTGTLKLSITSGGTTYTATATTSAAATLTAYSGETVTVTATAGSGYQLATLTRGNNSMSNNGTWSVSSAADFTATFTEKPKAANEVTATAGATITGNNNLVQLQGTFYDYFTDHEMTGGWFNAIDAHTDAWVDTDWNVANRNPYTILNSRLSSYAQTNNVARPMYFGSFYWDNTYHDPKYYRSEATNNGHLINDSNQLGGGTKALPGLAGKTLDGNTIHHYGTGTNENSVEMGMFNKELLAGSPSDTITVYFVDALAWNDLQVHYWGGATSTTWPGVAMTYTGKTNEYNQKIYKADIPSGTTGIIFNGKGNQTVDITTDIYNGSEWWTINDQDGSKYKVGYLSGSGVYNGAVAEIVNSPFPVRKTTKDGIDYYEFDSTGAKDNLYFDNLTSGSPVAQYGAGTNYGVMNGYNNGWSFMPFDRYDSNYLNNDSFKQYGKDLAFGMKLDVNFTLGQGGKINDVAQTFDFTGDDDLWVYVDGKLILDLGGDHAKTSGTINFASRTVTLSPAPNTTLSTTRNQSFADLVDNTDPTKLHKMTIYYMERGMHESNLKFGFSFAPIEDTYDVEKVADISELNKGLKSQFNDTYNYENAGNNTNNKIYTVYNSSTNEEVTSRTTSARSFYINKDQYASFKKIFQAHQVLRTTESASQYYSYDTTYKVVDMINDDYVIKAGSGRATGDFVFFNTSEDAIEGLSTTHIRTIFTNKLQTQSFMVTKEIDGYDDSSTEFPVIITMKMSPGGSVSDIKFNTEGLVYKSSADDYATERTLGAGGYTTIKEGEHLLFEGIPAGAKVTVYEPTSNNTKYTPAITGNGNCYKYVGIENTASDNQPQRSTDTNNVYTDITIQLGHFDTITIHNTPKMYLVKYTVPTRLYGNKVYKLSGLITPAMVAQGYIKITDTDSPEDRHTAFITEKFMTVHCPFESIFMKDVTWDPQNIVYTDANPAGYDDYVRWAASNPTAKTLTVKVDTNGDDYYDTTVSGLACGGEIKLPNGNYITGTKDGDTPSYWDIYSADTNAFVTRSYSTDLMYVAYDNYLIKAVYGRGKGSELYNQHTNAVVNDLGITRSHWNDTVSGNKDSETYKDIEGQTEVTKPYNYYYADTEYDRLYLDIELAFEATGKMINTYSADEVKAGYEVCVLNEDGTVARVHATVNLNNESIDNKNRIHAYYGFKNSESNRGKKLGIRAFIINGSGSSTVYSKIMPFELNTVGSMVG